MTAIAELRRISQEKYPSYSVELDEGTVVLTGIMDLSDEQLKNFTDTQAELAKLDESENLAGLRAKFVELFAGVADNPELARTALGKEGLGVLTVLLEEYAGALNAGTKSADTE